jgi:hypothetical protein
MLTKDIYVNLRGVLSKKIPWVDFGLVGWGVALIEKHKWCPTKRPLFHPLQPLWRKGNFYLQFMWMNSM